MGYWSRVNFNFHDIEYSGIAMLPLSATWYVTRNCDFRCTGCYSVSDELVFLKDDISTNEALRLIDQLSLAEIFLLNFAGGEPAKRQDFFSIAKYARDSGMSIQVSTNGKYIYENGVSDFLRAGFQAVQVSLDSLDRTVNDALRGCGAYKFALGAIEALARSELSAILAIAIRDENFPDPQELVEFVNHNNIQVVKLQIVEGQFNWAQKYKPLIDLQNQLKKCSAASVGVFSLVDDGEINQLPKKLIILPNGSLTVKEEIQQENRFNILSLGVESAWAKLAKHLKIAHGAN